MTENKTVNLYDFDRCLIRTPDHQSHNDHLRELYHWYDSPDSLDMNQYNIYCIENVAEDIRRRNELGELTFLVTQRVDTLEKEILTIFERFNINLHRLHMLGRKEHKGKVMSNIVTEFGANHVRAFDDSLSELHSYSNYAKQHDGLTLDLFYIDNSKILKISEPIVHESDRILIRTRDTLIKDVG